jgi:hypothetical protein
LSTSIINPHYYIRLIMQFLDLVFNLLDIR